MFKTSHIKIKHHKILRHSIQGITDSSIKRLARRAGITRISSLVYEEVRGITKLFLEELLIHVVNRVEATKTHTITVTHVEPSLDVAIYSDAITNFKCHGTKKEDASALSEIRHYQKDGCLSIPYTAFNRLIREVVQDYKTGLRISENASLLIQYAAEAHIVSILSGAIIAAIHAGRTNVQPKDLQLVRHIRPNIKVVPTDPHVPVVSFDSGIKEVLFQIYSKQVGITSDAKSQLNFILNKLASALITSANDITVLTNRSTLSSSNVQTAVRDVLPGELAKHAVADGVRAVTRFTSGAKVGEKFDVKEVRKLMKGCELRKVRDKPELESKKCDRRVSATASVYLTAVLQYISAEILELSGAVALQDKRDITARDLLIAIDNDEELKVLKKRLNINILGGGVVPYIASVLIPKKK